ncbi:MAG: hypothetical protein L0191_10390, partial [Acidobacteria bacterium]|nr:hypothetical protein [Acidobacteriota bacterium]
PDARLWGGAAGEEASFFDLFYQMEGIKSGMHHPDGLLWIRTPEKKHSVTEEKIPLTAIAPTLLAFFGIEPPAFMRAQCLRSVA